MAHEVACSIATAVPGTVRAWRNLPAAIDRSLPDGPWLAEPTKVQWVDAATSLPCLIVRNRLGALCGYSGVTASHPLHQVGYNDAYDRAELSVHGGLTFADGCAHSEDESTGVCHIPEPGASDDIWWFGLDCAHCFDLIPGMLRIDELYDLKMHNEDVYRDLAYVAGEVTSLASQLAAIQEAA